MSTAASIKSSVTNNTSLSVQPSNSTALAREKSFSILILKSMLHQLFPVSLQI